MTANQLVAYNLRRARESMDWTQQQAALQLEPYLGKRWSVASFSIAERSADNGRTREFDANELLAFARAFGRPLAWFFTPPPDVESVDAGAALDVTRSVSRAELLEAAAALSFVDKHLLRRTLEAMREQTASLESLVEQLENPTAVDPGSVGSVGFARVISDEEWEARTRLAAGEEEGDG